MGDHVLTRRAFAHGCALLGGIAALGAVSGCVSSASAADGEPLSQCGFLVDMGKCVGCGKCAVACRQYNHLSPDTPDRRTIATFENARQENVYVSTSCMHCDDPNCMRVCPAGAISKGDAGIVSVDKDKCIGCKYCYQACPYGVPNYNSEAMDKCDCCLGAGIAPGDTPYCAQACMFGALKYGPIEELKESARGKAVPVGDQCGPNCYLIGEVS